MKRMFKLKNLFLISFATIAGIFAFSQIYNIATFDDKSIIVEEAKADESDYLVIWYHLACGWGNDNEFCSDVSSHHHYIYKIGNATYNIKNYFGKGSPGDTTYSEVHGARLAKIFLPKEATAIQFVSTSNPYYNRGRTVFIPLDSSKNNMAYVLDSYQWNSTGTYQDGGFWVSYNTLISEYFKKVWFTVLTSWNSGESNLPNFYVWSQMTLANDVDKGGTLSAAYCAYQLRNRPTVVNNGKTMIEILIPVGSSAYLEYMKIRTIVNTTDNEKNTIDLSLSSINSYNRPVFYVNTNNGGGWGATNQSGYWREYDDASVKLCTFDGNMLFRKYVNCPAGSSDWNDAGAKTAVYYWDDSGHNCWSQIAEDSFKYYSASGSGYDAYNDYFVNPTNLDYQWTHFKFVRLNNTCTVPSFDDAWFEGANMDIDSRYNCYGPKWNNNSTDSNFNWLTIDNIHTYRNNTQLYLDLYEMETDWESAGAVFAAYLYGSNNYSGVEWVKLNLVNGFYNENQSINTALYELIIPSGNYTNAIFVRLKPEGAEGYDSENNGLNWNNKWNQTPDLHVDLTKNVCKLTNWNAGNYDWNLTDEGRMLCYGRYFNLQVVCDEGVHIPDNWDVVKSEYSHLCLDIKSLIRASVANPEGTSIEQAVSKYDDIVFRRRYAGHDDFMNRNANDGTSGSVYKGTLNSIVPGFNPFNIESETSITTVIIIIASSVSLLSITALSILLVKKRSSNRKED